jgi:hypothetical protein
VENGKWNVKPDIFRFHVVSVIGIIRNDRKPFDPHFPFSTFH